MAGIEKYGTDHYEHFYNMELLVAKPDTIKAYLPKYMPKISGGEWRQGYPINQSILANAPECSVSLPSIVTEQGYYTLTKYPLEQPDFTSKLVELKPNYWRVPTWCSFLAEVMHGDTKMMRFTGKV